MFRQMWMSAVSEIEMPIHEKPPTINSALRNSSNEAVFIPQNPKNIINNASWIYTGSNTWWKSLCSGYHPECIIIQKPECLRCTEKYKSLERWKTIFNKTENCYNNKILCKDCNFLLDKKRNFFYKFLKRETTGKM